MATLKNTKIDDTGYLGLPTGSNAQRPNTGSAGMIRWNTDNSVLEGYDGTEWKQFLTGNLGTESNPATSAQALLDAGITESGDYWIKPTGQTAYEIYCDLTNQSGGWMLVAVGREGTSTETGNRDWWRDGGDTAGAYATGLKQTNLTESGNTNPRYMSNEWIRAACGGNTWNDIEMICNRTLLSDSLYYRSAANNFAWSNFESSPAAFNLTVSRHTGQWATGTTTYTHTGNYWTDTLSAGVAGNNATRIFTWTWNGHVSGGVQYTGWSAGSSVSAPPGFEAATENHAIQFVNVFVR